jgi:gamma-glutamyltranspeptidase/glutathione hydrolase
MPKPILQSHPVYTRREVVAENGVCSAGHPQEAEAGVRMMQAGGNAVDALVAAAFMGFVLEPHCCGLGGYGHTTVWIAKLKKFVSFDHYGRAPGAARPDMFQIDPRAKNYRSQPRSRDGKAEDGPLSIITPGAVAGFCDLHGMFGKLPLKQILEPAIDAAEAGVIYSPFMVQCIASRLDLVKSLPETADALLPNGELPVADHDKLDTRALARTLKQIATRGKKAFHTGRTAQAIERLVKGVGGILTADDLTNYQTRILYETPATYRGHDYVTCYDQVGYEALNILEHFDLAKYGPDSLQYRHLAAEAMAIAFADSLTHYGDPDFVNSPVTGLASRAFAAKRRKEIRLTRAISRPVAPGDPWPYDDGSLGVQPSSPGKTSATIEGTSQMAAADHSGNMAATIVSVSSGYGSMVYVPEVGIFLNNSMQNFDLRPDHPNSIQPGKMPFFAVPALIATKNGLPRIGIAGSGGYRILTGVLHTLMNHIDHKMTLEDAIEAPRVHCQGDATNLDSRISQAIQARLAEMGHTVTTSEIKPDTHPFANICAVAYNPRKKTLHASASPPWKTGAAGY